MRPAILVDLDSTLCDTQHRQHMILEGPERELTDWVAYSMACSDDTPIEGTCQLVRILHDTHYVVIASGRSEEARELTEKWLDANNVPYDALELRTAESPRRNEDLKWAIAMKYTARGHKVVLMIEDWPPVRDLFQKHGIPTLLVATEYDTRQAMRDMQRFASGDGSR